jgi:hypothetical protein
LFAKEKNSSTSLVIYSHPQQDHGTIQLKTRAEIKPAFNKERRLGTRRFFMVLNFAVYELPFEPFKDARDRTNENFCN